MTFAEIHPNPFMATPFVVLLAAIALAPLFFAPWWSRHFAKVTLALAALTLAYYIIILRARERALHTAAEYVSFICLIGALFVISGGIHINVKGEATPKVNVLSDPGIIDAVAPRAICAAPITKLPAPKVDSRTRTQGPPTLRCTICRRV